MKRFYLAILAAVVAVGFYAVPAPASAAPMAPATMGLDRTQAVPGVVEQVHWRRHHRHRRHWRRHRHHGFYLYFGPPRHYYYRPYRHYRYRYW